MSRRVLAGIGAAGAGPPPTDSPTASLELTNAALTNPSGLVRTVSAGIDGNSYTASYWFQPLTSANTSFFAMRISDNGSPQVYDRFYMSNKTFNSREYSGSVGRGFLEFPSDQGVNTNQWYHHYVYHNSTTDTHGGFFSRGTAQTAYVVGESYPQGAGEQSYWAYAGGQHLVGGQTSIGSADPMWGRIYDYYIIFGAEVPITSFLTVGGDGQYRATKYNGPFGNGSINLDFMDAGDLGLDVSGQGNNFAVQTGGAAQTIQSLETPERIEDSP